METKVDSRLVGIIAILGIMLIVESVFMAWIGATIDTIDLTVSGTQLSDFADQVDSIASTDYSDWHTSAGYIVFALGLIMLILEMVSIAVPEASKSIRTYLPLINLIFGIVIIIVAALFMGWDIFGDLEDLGYGDDFKAGAGVWAAILGAVICILCNIGQVYDSLKKMEA
ncbi:MAG: hypothetical protein ACOX8X_02775 [Methanomethylophilus sp.]|jgi:uncharacterized membrane protein YidH (DUF202 family)